MTVETVKAFDVSDETWMGEALLLARQAGEEEEVPVGAVMVKDGKVIDPTLAVVIDGDADRFGSEYFGVEIVQLSKSVVKIPELKELFEKEVIKVNA